MSPAQGKAVKDADPARKAVYAWEDTWPGWNRNSLSLRACRELVREACALYEVEAPVVKQHGHGLSWSEPEDENTISFQSESRKPGNGGKNKAVALHEAAHHIAYHLHGKRIQDHGPTFLGYYLDLLVHFSVAPAAALHHTARKHKLKWRSNLSQRFFTSSRASRS